MSRWDKEIKKQEFITEPVKEVVAEIKPEKIEKPVAKATEAMKPQAIIAAVPVDVYVSQLVSSQPSTLEELEVKSHEFKDVANRMALPREVDELFKARAYAPRWIFKSKRAVDYAIHQRGWALVTQSYFPDLPDHLFSATGVIENGDSILGFMPEIRAAKLRSRPGEISTEKTKNLPIDAWKNDTKGERYYKPSLSEERDGEEITSGVQA